MPKTRARKREHGTRPAALQPQHEKSGTTRVTAATRRKAAVNPRLKTAENLLMPSLVALGCWGLAFSFIFLTSDTNHYLYGGMAIIMALMWTVMVGMRITRMRQVRQNVHQ